MTFLECLDEILSQKCVLRKYSLDGFGSKTITSATTVDCYAFQGDRQRRNRTDEPHYSEPQVWKVILPVTTVAPSVGDEVYNVRDLDGNQVLASGTVSMLDTYHHWSEGQQFFVVSLASN
jgi:hypothetical protein